MTSFGISLPLNEKMKCLFCCNGHELQNISSRNFWTCHTSFQSFLHFLHMISLELFLSNICHSSFSWSLLLFCVLSTQWWSIPTGCVQASVSHGCGMMTERHTVFRNQFKAGSSFCLALDQPWKFRKEGEEGHDPASQWRRAQLFQLLPASPLGSTNPFVRRN